MLKIVFFSTFSYHAAGASFLSPLSWSASKNFDNKLPSSDDNNDNYSSLLPRRGRLHKDSLSGLLFNDDNSKINSDVSTNADSDSDQTLSSSKDSTFFNQFADDGEFSFEVHPAHAELFSGNPLWYKDAKSSEAVGRNFYLSKSDTVLLYFSASWCGPCRRFTPILSQFSKALSQKKVKIVFIPEDEEEEDAMAYYLQEHGDWLMAPHSWAWKKNGGKSLAHTRLMQRAEIQGFPTVLLVDERGRPIPVSQMPEMSGGNNNGNNSNYSLRSEVEVFVQEFSRSVPAHQSSMIARFADQLASWQTGPIVHHKMFGFAPVLNVQNDVVTFLTQKHGEQTEKRENLTTRVTQVVLKDLKGEKFLNGESGLVYTEGRYDQNNNLRLKVKLPKFDKEIAIQFGNLQPSLPLNGKELAKHKISSPFLFNVVTLQKLNGPLRRYNGHRGVIFETQDDHAAVFLPAGAKNSNELSKSIINVSLSMNCSMLNDSTQIMKPEEEEKTVDVFRVEKNDSHLTSSTTSDHAVGSGTTNTYYTISALSHELL